MKVKWIKGNIEPPENGEYYVIREVVKTDENITLPKGYIEIDTDYFNIEHKEWIALGKNNPYYKILAWANILHFDIPEELKGKINCYFGVDIK